MILIDDRLEPRGQGRGVAVAPSGRVADRADEEPAAPDLPPVQPVGLVWQFFVPGW